MSFRRSGSDDDDDDDNLSSRRRARRRSSVDLSASGGGDDTSRGRDSLGSSNHSRSPMGRRSSRRQDDLGSSAHSGSSQLRRSIGESASRSRTPNPSTRAERVGRVLDGSEDAASRSGRAAARAVGSAVNHEDEIERIREIRARRLRHERLERGEKDDDGKAPGQGEGRRSVDHRARRREQIEARRAGEDANEPRRFRSTPAISRRDLESAGIVRRGRSRMGEQRPGVARDLSPRDRSGTDDEASPYSRRPRRGRSERNRADIEERLEARRARRREAAESTEGSTSTPDLNARDGSQREAVQRSSVSSLSDPLGPPSEQSAFSGNSSFPGSLIRAENDSSGESAPSRTPALNRSRSAEEDILAVGEELPEEAGAIADREAKRSERLGRLEPAEQRSTDLTTRLRMRRQARAAERQAATGKTTSAPSVDRPPTIVTRSKTAPSTSPATSPAHANGIVPENESPEISTSSPSLLENIGDLEIESDEDDSSPGWSVRMKVLSAVDLPLNVVPNMPLCPVLKLGLLKLPADLSVDPSVAVTQKLGNNSIEKVHTARVRSTTPKILSKRDNGTVDFHQEFRWDDVQNPTEVALFVELSARAAATPQNIKDSPPPLSQSDAFRIPVETDSSGGQAGARLVDANGDPMRILNRNPSSEASARGFGAFWKRATNQKQAELEAAEAAAAVARMIIEQDKTKAKVETQEGEVEPPSSGPAMKITTSPQSDYSVTLKHHDEDSADTELTEDVRLGSLLIPLRNLPLDMAIIGNKSARLEQWYQIEKTISESTLSKKPSVQFEITFSSPGRMNDSEDELKLEEVEDAEPVPAPSKRMSMMNPAFVKKATDEVKVEDPVLEPGVVDFITVVGCRDIGNQKNDNGHKGWVTSTPESVILEQFPPDNDFHQSAGRNALLPEMVQWFCFPEGCRLWRGSAPPTHADLNLKRFSASSPPNVASSLATFDACLNCTTSFTWFVIASNSDEYGSKLVKTYGAVIRFYAPAPLGVDRTQEDFVSIVSGTQKQPPSKGLVKRLWVPIGICLTSNLPIIGTMEAMLLRLCEELVLKVGSNKDNPPQLHEIHTCLANLIVNCQKPIAGAVNCSVPFLSGERFLLSLPPTTGLPALPHGRSVVSVCRLLGAEGLNFLLAAVLTECKILIHSQDIADIAMVAEVVTALTYPFSWSLPYIPILPLGMLEFVEAPLSFILGIPTCNLQLVEPYIFEELVVIDLDNGFSPIDYYEGNRRSARMEKRSPTPLPANVATNISKAWYRLLRAEEEIEEQFGNTMLGEQSLPRLEDESLAEREFRISVAVEVCSLLRGYDECVGPVFNRDKFLKISPALFEEGIETRGVGAALKSRGPKPNQKSISPRSKRFLSLLVNTQNFQQLLESLESEEASLFHEIMDLFEENASDNKSSTRSEAGPSKIEKCLSQLAKTLQKAEDKIPTYLVDQANEFDLDDIYDDGLLGDNEDDGFPSFGDLRSEEDPVCHGDGNTISSFVDTLLAPVDGPVEGEDATSSSSTAVSMEYIEKLESTPWKYQPLFDIAVDGEPDNAVAEIKEKVKLRDAIGERRFRAWKMAQDQKAGSEVDLAFISDNLRASKQSTAIDLTSLISSATSDTSESISLSSESSSLRTSALSLEEQRVADAKNRDVIRRCLDKANVGNEKRYGDQGGADGNPFLENGRDLMAEAEKALRNPSAQRFLLSILAQRSRLENQRARTMRHRQSTVMSSVSRLDTQAFECLVRLSCAMLDSCMEYNEYEPGYRLLTHTAGFIMVLDRDEEDDGEVEMAAHHVVSMTSRIGLHPFFADLGVWNEVMALHLRDRQSEKRTETTLSEDESEDEEDEGELEYEAAVATLYEMVGYGIPGEELSRFAMRASEKYGWFCDDRGRQLLMLARRISLRRDQANPGGAADAGDIELISKGKDRVHGPTSMIQRATTAEDADHTWVNVGWCHPAAPSSVLKQDAKVSDSTDGYMKRSPVTALASFGSSVVATGGLDGSVFIAHSVFDDSGESGTQVRGIHLDWGSASRAGAGSSSDGVYGVGAVSCLAASYGSSQHIAIHGHKDTAEEGSDDGVLASMEGSRVVAGTTAGDLRVWSVKDVYSAVQELKKGEDNEIDQTSMFGSGTSSTRLKFSLRGRALSGHRGGVTCIDVPSQVYRPDSLVTGGADGLIKMWSLRAPTSGRRSSNVATSQEAESVGPRNRGGDALDVLSGHNGRVTCVQSAWHGDRLLSGGADRTLRVWDLTGTGKCLHRLTGHSGWVTNVKYWGPNTIVSASTDRAVALWDARIRDSPLFMLRHHYAPVSDLLVGSRTDPTMVTAAADGTVATWDFRTLSASKGSENTTSDNDGTNSCNVVRRPAVTMKHGLASKNGKFAVGAEVKLARGFRTSSPSILSVGSDAIVREWEMATGKVLDESRTGHCDAVTCFTSFGQSNSINGDINPPTSLKKGILTCSWDGTIQMRRIVEED
eukprot:scaffold3373_cov137-Cylindrotheca_fusiformis.AAC.24